MLSSAPPLNRQRPFARLSQPAAFEFRICLVPSAPGWPPDLLMAAPNGVSTTVTLISDHITSIKGVHVSEKRNEWLVVTESTVFAFDVEHGKHGVYNILAEAASNESTRVEAQSNASGRHSNTFRFSLPTTLLETDEGDLLIPDGRTHAVQKLNVHSGSVETIFASATRPSCVVNDSFGRLVIVDGGSHVIGALSTDGTYKILAGVHNYPGFLDGPCSKALLHNPICAVHVPGIGLVFSDCGNRRIRLLSTEGSVSTVAGSGECGTKDGPALSATFSNPTALRVNHLGSILILEPASQRLRLLQAGVVTTVMKNTKTPENLYPGNMAGFDVTRRGKVLLAADRGLFQFDLPDHLKESWTQRNSDSRLSYLSTSSYEYLDPNSSSSMNLSTGSTATVHSHGQGSDSSSQFLRAGFVLPLPRLSRTYFLPRAAIRIRCPLLLQNSTIRALQSLDMSQKTFDHFLAYLLDDSLPLLRSLEHRSDGMVVELATIAKITGKEALYEICAWNIFLFSSKPTNATSLATDLKAAGRVITSLTSLNASLDADSSDTKYEIDNIVSDLIGGIVLHNMLFSDPKSLMLLKGALPEPYNQMLKDALKRDKRLGTVRRRLRAEEPVLGLLAGDFRKLWREVIETPESALDADFSLEVLKLGKPYLIPCHSFVLYSRWSYIRPILRNAFSEQKERKLQLIMPDGEMFSFTWASLFLRYLYTGSLDVIENRMFVHTTLKYADYLMLETPPYGKLEPDEPDHSQLLYLLHNAGSFLPAS